MSTELIVDKDEVPNNGLLVFYWLDKMEQGSNLGVVLAGSGEDLVDMAPDGASLMPILLL